MDTIDSVSDRSQDQLSDKLDALRNVPRALFRGIDCGLLAEQYRRFRALEAITDRAQVTRG